MEINPHDLLEIHSKSTLLSDSDKPDWVDRSLLKAPFVVVRRARSPKGLLAVGIRGFTRNERFAAYVASGDVIRHITPEYIAEEKDWQMIEKDIYLYLDAISHILEAESLVWGPTGSIGFELTSGMPTVTPKSDIDLMIRYTSKITPGFSRKLLGQLDKLPIQIDIQVETRMGAFALREYAHSKGEPILLKTKDGPVLQQIYSI